MNPRYDRRKIIAFLAPHFPELDGMSSDEVGAFLNQVTGLSIAPDVINAGAFDEWRKALRTKGYDTWGHSAEKIAELEARAADLASRAAKAREEQAARTKTELARLARLDPPLLPLPPPE